MQMGNTLRNKVANVWRRPQQRRTFSAILLVTIVILATVAGSIAPKIMNSPDKARREVAKHDIGVIMQALNLYRRDHGHYPTQKPGLRALIEKSETPVPNRLKDDSYLKRLPSDPWGNAYKYRNPGVHGQIDVFSYGADGKRGGEGTDADIGSWE
ncbi:MAG: type II secretion system major pseudopilin GspG [Paraburkholderia sp.]|jgi:general secretion pathway protein G|uniref:type II secretion system major pseudopilin GspG n=1 Tax=Paraburkholderia sp. TaxID=1926495 RepID=UPI00397BA6A8